MEFTPAQHEVLRRAQTRLRYRNSLTIEDLSEFLGISVRTIQRMHASGKGPPRLRWSHRFVYRVSKVTEWVQDTKRLQDTPLGIAEFKSRLLATEFGANSASRYSERRTTSSGTLQE